MKRLIFLTLLITLISVLLITCRENLSYDEALFTVEEIDGVRYVHNHSPQLDSNSGVKLVLLGKIGKLEGKKDEDILYDPMDVARLPNGDILILEGRGCAVKHYNKDYEYISSFGQMGQGPGDLLFPFCIRFNENKIFVADRDISIFSLDGSYEDGFKIPIITRFGSIGAQYRTSGMAIIADSHVILPSHPSKWIDSGEHKLLSVYNKKGSIIRSFGAVKQYENQELMLNANIVSFAKDNEDNLYIAYGYQNKIAKYSQDGEMIFSANRTLPYEVRNVMKVELFKSGNLEKEFPWPSVSSVSKGIGVDHKNRVWVLTFLKQPNRFLSFDKAENPTDCYEFDVFDSDGVLLFEVLFPNVRFDNFSVCDDRIYLIDTKVESCVYEYRIVEKD